MVYVWDEAKREANLAKHGLDFADVHLVYENPYKVTFASTQADENRSVDIAMVEISGQVLTLVYVKRGEDVRVISLRRASRRERKMYAEAKEQD